MSSETLTESPVRDAGGISPWQFFLLLSMLGATVAVVLTRHTHPVALLLLSGAVISAGLVAVALHRALAGFLGRSSRLPAAPSGRTRAILEADKALVLRSIKELEFDRAMGKVSDADFAEISGRLRARAMALMEDLDRQAASPTAPRVRPTSAARAGHCVTCGTINDTDARFCKQCGGRLA